jgi:hypothetical protein
MEVSGLHALANLATVKEPQYPLNMRPGRPQRQYGYFGEEKNLLTLPGFEPWTVHS